MRKHPVHKTDLGELTLAHRGKVRDMYNIPGEPDKLLMVATDRISACDVIMEDAILGKGKVLTTLTLHWLDFLNDIVPNHFITANVDNYPEICKQYEEILWGRSMIVKKYIPLPIECIVRGYISGSFWSAYKKALIINNVKDVLGHSLRTDMRESEQFDEILFTPSTKADAGEHDENISMTQMAKILATFLSENNLNNIDSNVFSHKIASISVALYKKAAIYARERGIIIADTKFEIGIDVFGNPHLIDEVLTPDSSRFWPLSEYEVGKKQPSFDKQYLRDYLASIGWDKSPPSPELPLKVINQMIDLYNIAEQQLLAK